MEIDNTEGESLVLDVEWVFSIPITEKIDDPNKKKSFIVYVVYVGMKGSVNLTWIVKRRYSEFKKLHHKLQQLFPTTEQITLPGKHLLTKSLDYQLITERRLRLENYLNHLAKNSPKVFECEFFQQFIEHKISSPFVTERNPKKRGGSNTMIIRKVTNPSNLNTYIDYLVVGMKLKTKATYKSKVPEELSFVKGDVVTYRGSYITLPDGKYMLKVALRDGVGYVNESHLDVVATNRNTISISSRLNTHSREDLETHSDTFAALGRSKSEDMHGSLKDKERVVEVDDKRNHRLTIREMDVSSSTTAESSYNFDSLNLSETQEEVSEDTQSKVKHTKGFFDDYYKDLSNYLASREQRRSALLAKLSNCSSPEEKQTLTNRFKASESALLRRKRKKMSLDDFEVVDMIGKGGFGKVYLCINKINMEYIALKKVKKSVILERNKLQSIRTEREVLKGTESPWLVKLICSFQDQNCLYFAMQYAPGGNLKNLLANIILPEQKAKFYIAEIIVSVKSLHALGFVHRDLKPDNFLFDKDGHILLADFGLSKGGILKKIEDTASTKPIALRIHIPTDSTFRTFAITPQTTAQTLILLLAKKLLVSTELLSDYAIYEHNKDAKKTERKIQPTDNINSIIKSWPSLLSDDYQLIFKKVEKHGSMEEINLSSKNRERLNSLTRKSRRERSRSHLTNKKAYSFVGSPHYMAPEIISQEGYDELVDWWSVGCILYEMCVGFPPFMGDTPQEVFGNILDHTEMLQFPEPDDDEVSMSPICEDIIRDLLLPATVRLGCGTGYRPTDSNISGFAQIQTHLFFKDFNWDNLRSEIPPFVPHLDSPTDTSYFHLSEQEKDDSLSTYTADSPNRDQTDDDTRSVTSNKSPKLSSLMRNSLTSGYVMEAPTTLIRSKSSNHAGMELDLADSPTRGISGLSQSPVSFMSSSESMHRRGKSYDFVGFTFKPTSWIDVGENKYLEI